MTYLGSAITDYLVFYRSEASGASRSNVNDPAPVVSEPTGPQNNPYG